MSDSGEMERRLGGGLGWGMEEGSKSQQAADVRAARKFPDLDMAVSTFEGKFFRVCILYHTSRRFGCTGTCYLYSDIPTLRPHERHRRAGWILTFGLELLIRPLRAPKAQWCCQSAEELSFAAATKLHVRGQGQGFGAPKAASAAATGSAP